MPILGLILIYGGLTYGIASNLEGSEAWHPPLKTVAQIDTVQIPIEYCHDEQTTEGIKEVCSIR